MGELDLFRLAAGAVRAHRLRSALTMLGILIGIASVILLPRSQRGRGSTEEMPNSGLRSSWARWWWGAIGILTMSGSR